MENNIYIDFSKNLKLKKEKIIDCNISFIPKKYIEKDGIKYIEDFEIISYSPNNIEDLF